MTKFIIFSKQRTGSHYLRYLLNSNKYIQCNADFLSGDIIKKGIDWAYEEGFKTDKVDIKLVGFLAKFKQDLHYDIKRYPDIKVIVLLRRNYLATLLSKMIASKLGCYTENGLSLYEARIKRMELPAISIDIDTVKEFIIECKNKEAEVLLFLKDHPDWCTVYYEELSNNKYIRSIYKWLGISGDDNNLIKLKFGRGSEKLDPRPIEKAIENYEELFKELEETNVHWNEKGKNEALHEI